MLKLSFEESKIIRLIESAMKDLERNKYSEIRSSILDSYIKKMMNIHSGGGGINVPADYD
jgi:hypothetical protein